MATIDYTDKIDNHDPPEGLVTAADMNEIKDVVNANAGELNPIDTITTTESISDLRLVEGTEIGQTIEALSYHEGSGVGGGKFTTIDNEAHYFLRMVAANDQGIFQNSGYDIPVSTSQEVAIRFRITEEVTTNYRACTLSGFSVMRLQIETHNSDTSLGFKGTTAGQGSVNRVEDSFGNLVDNLDLEYDTWYTIYINPDSETAVTGFQMGRTSTTNANIDIASFSVVNEFWEVKEDTTTEVISNLGTSIPVINSPALAEVNLDDGFKYIQTTDGRLLQRVIINNTVSLYDFGAISNINVDVYDNDCSVLIQQALDSPYRLNTGGGNFYCTEEMYMNTPKDIICTGDYMHADDKTEEDRTQDYYNNKHTTLFYSNLNINFFTDMSSGANWFNGLVYTENIPNHTGHAWRIELTGEIWGGSLNGINVLGNREDLLNTGIGTIGLMIDSDTTSYGFAINMRVSGNLRWCAAGIKTGIFSDVEGVGAWANTIDFNVHMRGCKKFYDMPSLNFVEINGMLQDSNVLNEDEKDFFAVTVGAKVAEINTFLHDRTHDDPVGTYRHGNNYVDADGEYVVLGWRTMRNIDIVDTPNANKNIQLSDPYRFAVSNSDQLIISQLNNQVRFNGDTQGVTYIGYDAIEDSWFDANLYPADDILNVTPLTADSNACQITEVNDGLLTVTGEGRSNKHQTKVEFGFAEVVVPFRGNDNIKRVAIALSDIAGVNRIYPKKIQLILYNNTDRYSFTTTSDNLSRNFYDLFRSTDGTINLTEFNGMIIRVIGSTDYTNSIYIEDIAVTNSRMGNKPVIHIGGGQDINGDLSFPNSDTGIILKDRTLNTEFRLVVDNGVLSVESVI